MTGAPLVMGALVNQAAFKTIAPICSRFTAQTMVENAVKAGVISSQATELHAKWVDLITADPSMAILLAYQSGSFKDLVQAKVAGGLKKGDAVCAAVREYPDTHRAWLEAGGGTL